MAAEVNGTVNVSERPRGDNITISLQAFRELLCDGDDCPLRVSAGSGQDYRISAFADMYGGRRDEVNNNINAFALQVRCAATETACHIRGRGNVNSGPWTRPNGDKVSFDQSNYTNLFDGHKNADGTYTWTIRLLIRNIGSTSATLTVNLTANAKRSAIEEANDPTGDAYKSDRITVIRDGVRVTGTVPQGGDRAISGETFVMIEESNGQIGFAGPIPANRVNDAVPPPCSSLAESDRNPPYNCSRRYAERTTLTALPDATVWCYSITSGGATGGVAQGVGDWYEAQAHINGDGTVDYSEATMGTTCRRTQP